VGAKEGWRGIRGTIPGVDRPWGFPCHCRSNNNPHPISFCYVCYVIFELDSVLNTDASVSLEFSISAIYTTCSVRHVWTFIYIKSCVLTNAF